MVVSLRRNDGNLAHRIEQFLNLRKYITHVRQDKQLQMGGLLKKKNINLGGEKKKKP